MNPRSPQFFGGLESLRGIAALLVVLYHITDWPDPITKSQFIRNGYLMVDVFFVLSGFVICHSYGSKIASLKDLGRFMLLRFGRLYPLHFFFLFVFLGLEVAKMYGESKYGLVPSHSHAFSINNGSSLVAHLLLVHPFFAFAEKTFDTPSWSIGVEFYMYLFFAFVILALGKRRLSAAAGILVLLAALTLHYLGFPHLHVMSGPPAFLRCCLGFFLGVLACQVFERYHLVVGRWPAGIGWSLLAAIAVFLALKPFGVEWDYLLPLLCAGLIISLAAYCDNSLARVFNLPTLRWLGKVSYSIYLSHEFVLIFMARVLTLTEKIFRQHFPELATSGALSCLGLFFVGASVGIILVVSQFTYTWIEVIGQRAVRRRVGPFSEGS